MRALKIDVEQQTITEFEHNGNWREIAPLIGNGCTTFTCPIIEDNGDTLYCDDEGLLKPIKGGFVMPNWSYPIAGNALFLGSNEEGNTCEVKMTLDELKENVRFLTPFEMRIWAAMS